MCQFYRSVNKILHYCQGLMFSQPFKTTSNISKIRQHDGKECLLKIPTNRSDPILTETKCLFKLPLFLLLNIEYKQMYKRIQMLFQLHAH